MSIPTDDDDVGISGRAGRRARDLAAMMAQSDEAAEWFVRLRDDNLSMRQRQKNVRWLKQSPTHIAELLRIQQVYKVLRAVKLENRSLGSIAALGLETDAPSKLPSNVIEFTPRVQPLPEPMQAPPRFASWKVVATAACIAFCVLLGLMVKAIWLDRTLRTELGEWRAVQLTDGTQVRIGPNSELRLSFGDDHRTVRLLRGEAMFSVAKDPARPFFVQSQMVGVLAVGTEFRVAHWGSEEVVAVTEGSVAVYHDGSKPVLDSGSVAPARLSEAMGAVALAAGEQVSVTRAARSRLVAKEKINVHYEQSWADGWLVFEDKTIAEVAREFNRRNRMQVVVTEPTIAARRLTLFRGKATDPESFAAALAVTLDLTLVREPNVLRIEQGPTTQDLDAVQEPEARTDGTGSDASNVNPNPI